MRLGLLLALAFFPRPSLAADVVVRSFGGADRDADAGAWLPARLADLVGEKLERLGVEVRDRRFETTAGAAAVIGGKVEPNNALDPSVAIAVEAHLAVGSGKPIVKGLSARAGEVEKVAAELAVSVAEALGRKISEPARAKLAEPAYPFAVQRFLGLARAHFDAQAYRKAMVMYDRAAQLVKLGMVPEAIEGRMLAEAELAGRGEATFLARADLAPPALVRAEVALKRGDDREAMSAFEAFLRATPEHALRWELEVPLERGAVELITRGASWVLQAGEGERSRLSIDPRTGTVLAREQGQRGLVALVGGQSIVLDQRTLSRIDGSGRVKWKLSLPLAPRGVVADSVELAGGVAGIMAEREVAWVETSFGELGQRAKNVRPLASGSAGILVELAPREGETQDLGLLRPGKKIPAWTAEVPRVLDAALTGDRVLLVGRGEILFLRTHDGKEAGRPISIGSPNARVIGADGRYAVLDLGEEGAIVVDVLGAEKTAVVRGPGAPIGCYTAANGVAVLYSTGDLFFFERDGRLLDRARVPGEPIRLVPGSPILPGPVAVTTRGLFAYAEVAGEASRLRDVDAMLRLAELLAKHGEAAAALRLVERVALASAGRVAEAERIRAELYEKRGEPAIARAARARADAIKDPSKTMPPFRLID